MTAKSKPTNPGIFSHSNLLFRICFGFRASCFVLAILATPHLLAEQSKADVWIVSGQSNACGRAELPGADPNPLVQMFDGRKWVEAKEPLPLGGTVGPWLAAATEVAKAGIPIRICGYASGGMPISHWDEEQGGWKSLSANIKAAGENAGVFLWYQGENDGVTSMETETYQKKLKDLVGRVRTLAKNPNMLVVIVQLAKHGGVAGSFSNIREAERQYVISDPNSLLVPALGRPGDLHLTKEGYFELGHEIGRALLRVRYQRTAESKDWPGPVMDSAVFSPNDNKTVLAHFAEVKKLSGAANDDFSASDASGEVKCTKVEAQNTRVALTFERALKTPAKVCYAYGKEPKAALADEAGNRAPAVQLEIGSGPVPDDKESKAPNGAGPLKALK
jgi:hypothetical protein